MPELPDVETFKRYLDATALHQGIAQVRVEDDGVLEGVSARGLQQSLKGCEFDSTRRHGKHLFVEVSGKEWWLRLHFGMSGSLAYDRDDEAPEHACIVFGFTNGYRLSYVSKRKIGKVGLVGKPDEWLGEHDVGPDALAMELPAFREMLAARHGMIKPALMDQSLIAGVGNLYADEVLFHAGIHPKAKADKLSGKETARLHRDLWRVLRKAVKCGADVEKLPASYLLPHRTEDGACPRCGGPWSTSKVGGRTTFHCADCQKL